MLPSQSSSFLGFIQDGKEMSWWELLRSLWQEELIDGEFRLKFPLSAKLSFLLLYLDFSLISLIYGCYHEEING